ncbi:MAG: cytochrome c biogenesis protein DipZ [Proteobacteria bacterium]|nr:cytochrome c biogenesis protein DipZ [Pseudomonadota bacterium]
MLLLLVAFAAGVLTILSPCVLPVLPFVFARADRPFLTNGLPLLVSMALVFAVVATLASVAGGWAVAANQYGRIIALVLLAAFGLSLLSPALGNRLMQPLVTLGNRVSSAAGDGAGIGPSLLLGVATGLLWAPCAGPVLGLILSGAALRGAGAGTTLLLLAYAAGSATVLAVALLVGGRVFAAMKRSLGFGEWARRALGAAVLIAVAAIVSGADTGFLARLSLARTTSLEQGLLDRVHPPAPQTTGAAVVPVAATALPDEGAMPALDGAVAWLNSPPLTAQALRGKVVLVDFWTYSCINCLRALPYVEAWARRYGPQGLVVIGVHAPEFAFEKDLGNVRKAVTDLGIGYPVAIDNGYAIWRAFGNQYWPAHYFIDAQGRIRHHHFGEGEYEESEQVIRQLLGEAGRSGMAQGSVAVEGKGALAPADLANVASPETYLGYERLERFASAGGVVADTAHLYTLGALTLNAWGLKGRWTIAPEQARLEGPGGSVVYRFHARDLHLVLGPSASGKPVRFRVTVDGRAPADSHGSDTDAAGNGVVSEQRLYQLLRQRGTIQDRTFEIQFLDPGVEVYAFTFG